MAKDINLTSRKWNDIIFEGKNKDYGAYEMRQSSSKRHVIALLVIVGLAIFVSFLPLLIETVASRMRAENLSESTVLADLQKELEEQVKEKDIIREETAPPPPPLKSTIQFTAPEIVDKVEEDQEIKAQEELAESKVQISVATVEGSDKGIDIADLQEHKVIAEAVDETVHDFVQQMPEFPGGEKELLKYLATKTVYPRIAQENGIQGNVFVQFVVERDGSVTDIVVTRGVDRYLDAEAIRVVKAMPKWIPGKQNGQTVRVRFSARIEFQLQ